jgi:sugar-specific transcriptional regulator TrmB
MLVEDSDIVRRFCKLGLTPRQARVYVSVLTNAHTIPEISDRTNLYEQDIYKIIKKLEKIGLVTRTAVKPIQVEALPVEKALNNLIEIQQRNVEAQRKTAMGIIDSIKKQFKPYLQHENSKFVLLPFRTEAYKNRTELAYENAKSTYDVFTSQELFPPSAHEVISELIDVSSIFLKHNVKVRVLIGCNKEENKLDEVFNKRNWPKRATAFNLTIKKACGQDGLYYAIIDGEELWVPLELSLASATLVTNNKEVIGIARKLFDTLWEDTKTVTLLEVNKLQRNKSTQRKMI